MTSFGTRVSPGFDILRHTPYKEIEMTLENSVPLLLSEWCDVGDGLLTEMSEMQRSLVVEETRVFHCRSPLPLTLDKYTQRLIKYGLEDYAVMGAIVLLLRVQKLRRGVLRRENVMKLFGVAVLVATKFMIDIDGCLVYEDKTGDAVPSTTAKFLSSVIGVPIDALLEMELQFLQLLEWKVFLGYDDLNSLYIKSRKATTTVKK